MKTYIIASSVIYRDDGKILILRRSDDDLTRPSESDLPGGEANEGEEPFAAAVREIVEETGLEFAVQDLRLVFGMAHVKQHTEEKADVNFVQLGFIAAMPAGQSVRLSHEHQDFGWQTLDQAIEGFANRPSKENFLRHLRDHDVEEKLKV